jgi:methionyl-tRNA formyltransferase
MSSGTIYNLTRALAKPYVGAHLIYKQRKIIIWKTEEVICTEMDNIEPVKVLEVSSSFIDVKSYNGIIRILEHEFETLPQIGEYL